METHFHSYRPSEGHRLQHDPFNAIVGPRPIGWISTVSKDGQRNLAPYSFFNAFNYIPPIIGFSSIGWKDSVRNAAETKAFVWNLVTMDLAEHMNRSSISDPAVIDEFNYAGLQSVPADLVPAPRVASSPVSFECRVTQIIRLALVEGQEVDTWLTLGEIVKIHIAQSLIEDGIYHTAASSPVLCGGGRDEYFEIRESAKFRMARP